MMTPFFLFLICLALAVAFFFVSIFLTPTKASREESIGRGTRFFLVVLRLVIGWHFLTEGWEKLSNPAWSGENYLRASTGPLADYFRGVADDELLAKLTVNADGTFPVALNKEWQRYFDAFVQEFEPKESEFKGKFKGDEEKSKAAFEKAKEAFPDVKKKAEIKLDQAKKDTLTWLTTKQNIKKLSPYVERPADMTVAERVAYYHQLLNDLDKIVAEQGIPYGSAAEEKVKLARDEADYIIKDLKKDLAKQTESMKEKLVLALPKHQQGRRLPPLPAPPISEWTQLQWSNHVVPWALTIVGGLLIVGLLTRPACLLGAVWMLMLYLSMLPLPGWPDPPRAEGHYLYINKNFIEMVALLVLATTPSGRWLGLDSLFGLLFSLRKTKGSSARVMPPRNLDPERARPVTAS